MKLNKLRQLHRSLFCFNVYHHRSEIIFMLCLTHHKTLNIQKKTIH